MLKAIDPDSSVSAVWEFDPAVDREGLDVDAIAADPMKRLDWRKLYKIKDGQTPTEWIIGAVPPGELTAIESDAAGKLAMVCWRTFLHSVRDIRPAGDFAVTSTGRDGKRVTDLPRVEVGGVEFVDPKHLARVMVRGLRQCARAIGVTAWMWNQLSEDDGKN